MLDNGGKPTCDTAATTALIPATPTPTTTTTTTIGTVPGRGCQA